MARFARLLGIATLALLPVGAGAQAPTPHLVGDTVWEITDRDVTPPHKLTTVNSEVTSIQRVGSHLYFIYRAYGDVTNPSEDGNHIYVRRFDLDAREFDATVDVFPELPVQVGSGSNYHVVPTLLRDEAGHLHAFAPCAGYPNPCPDISSTMLPPNHRQIPDLLTSSGWIPEENDPIVDVKSIGLPLRWQAADLPSDSNYFDLTGLYDPSGQTAHVIGEGRHMSNIDDPNVSHSGFGRPYYRFDSSGFDGPYLLIEPTSEAPAEFPLGGNVFPKARLVLGRETSGQRSLHLAWLTDKSFKGASPCVDVFCEVNYDVYYARSDDGGDTWESLDGAASVSLPGHLLWDGGADQDHWRIYEGNIGEQGHAFDVDANGYPVFALKKYREYDTGDQITVDGVMRVNQPQYNGLPEPIYDLWLYRWDGDEWLSYLIDDSLSYFRYYPAIRVDRLGRIWVFMASKYLVSTDGGATWTTREDLPGTSSSIPGGHSILYPDPENENYVFLAYPGTGSKNKRLEFAWLQLTPEVEVIESTAEHDGRVIDGLAANATDSNNKAIRIGDTNGNLGMRGFLSFDTSLLPEDVTISSATLSLKRGFIGYVGTSPLTAFAPAYVDVTSPYFGSSTSLEVSDYGASADASAAATLSDDGSFATASLGSTGIDAIDTAGTTQVRLRFNTATDSDGNWDYVGYYSSESSDKPTLTIEYWLD